MKAHARPHWSIAGAVSGLALICALSACSGDRSVSGTATPAPLAPPSEGSSPQAAPPASTSPARTVPGQGTCASAVSAMDPRARVAQLVVPGVNAGDPAAVADLVRTQQVGGIFVGDKKTTLLQNGALDGVQRAAKIPVSVAVDEEGGRVQRIDDLDGSLPSARQLAASKTPDEVRAIGEQRGKQLRARGVTVDYAPDADVSDEPDDAVIGDRSYSPDPEKVRQYAMAFAEGLRAGGVQPVLKHFPGHGHGSGDSHRGTVVTPPLDQLRRVDLVPYRDISEYGQVAVMVGHLEVPGLTGDEPASLAPQAYQLLRNEFHFTGPVITDDLGGMKAITDRFALPDAVLKALQAGADQALFSSGHNDVGAVVDRLQRAVESGELSGAQVTASLERVLAAKGFCRP
ncbi:glycoside hydrolase family 3 protein [Amycolatopsis rubida]|uniref:beta-N-acetylhexosaminidase n=2 Tax=Amycolatopsis rubida TaxID=112413 RepID=A0ABX0BLW3_9PSEU|nr:MULTISPECIES: glycoside hydrolase family 3 N-terminal domain-containing protein [Amycolatopsis]MYW90130.1 glycoside hydrolase family 3 protein [Amycolatopsis rubida]NEC55107.1 glycoside hydrolase family 3 protein [Amycolatopsis rubida]